MIIIKNRLEKNRLEENAKVFFHYASLQKTKTVKKLFLIEVIGGIFLILYSFVTPIYMKLCLFTGIICIPYSIIILLKFINRKKKDYTLIFNKEFKKIGNLEFIEKTYTFEKRNLKYEAVYGTDITNLEFSFDNYYKIWLEEENNILQFNLIKNLMQVF